MLLQKDEVLKRLCKLCSKVRDNLSVKNSVASDCFCGQSAPDPLRNVLKPSRFQFDSKTLKFIEDAVAERITLDGIAERYYRGSKL